MKRLLIVDWYDQLEGNSVDYDLKMWCQWWVWRYGRSCIDVIEN